MATALPARSICDKSQPPKISPCALANTGIAIARNASSDSGKDLAAFLTAIGIDCTVMRTLNIAFIVALALCASASANWFNRSEQYLAACQDEAVRRYHKNVSTDYGRQHVYQCMVAHGYAFKESCDKGGWANPDCYRLKYKTEGR